MEKFVEMWGRVRNINQGENGKKTREGDSEGQLGIDGDEIRGLGKGGEVCRKVGRLKQNGRE